MQYLSIYGSLGLFAIGRSDTSFLGCLPLLHDPGGDVLDWVLLLGIAGAENIVPEAPVQPVIASPVVVVLHVVVEVQSPPVMRQQCVDRSQEADCRHHQRVHWVEEGAHKMAHRSLQHRLERVHCILSKGRGLDELLHYPISYMMVAVHVLHKPVDVKEVMRQREPGVEAEHVNQDVFGQFP